MEDINISYSNNNYKFSDDSHLLITVDTDLKYSWSNDVTFLVTYYRGCSGIEGGRPIGTLWRGFNC